MSLEAASIVLGGGGYEAVRVMLRKDNALVGIESPSSSLRRRRMARATPKAVFTGKLHQVNVNT